MELRYILELARKWFWLLILAVLIGGAAGLIVNYFQPKVYEADSTLFVSSPNRSDYSNLLGDQQAAKAFALFPSSDPVLAAALQAVGDKSLTLVKLQSMVTVVNNLDTQFIVIKVRDSNPVRAAQLANEIAKQSIAQFQTTVTDNGQARKSVQDEIDNVGSEIKNLENEQASIQTRGVSGSYTPSEIAKINKINTNLGELRQLYSQLVTSYANLTSGISLKVTIIQNAEVPQDTVGGGVKLAVAIGMLVGLIAIVGVIIIIEQTDDKLRTPARVNKATGLSTLITVKRLPAAAKIVPLLNGHRNGTNAPLQPMLAVANYTSNGQMNGQSNGIVDMDKRLRLPTTARPASLPNGFSNNGISNPTQSLSRQITAKQASVILADLKVGEISLNGSLPDAFVTLGFMLRSERSQLALNGSKFGSVLITSPEKGDGKTLIASKVALGLASIGVEVVLVDANLRKPEAHSLFGLANRVGLSTFLTANPMAYPIDQIVYSACSALQQTGMPNLAVLSGGPSIESPYAALSSPILTAILTRLSERAFVVIDAPAVLTSSEAVILANKSDGILMVVDARHSAAAKLNQSAELLTRVNPNILGVVLNQVSNQS